MKFLTYFWGPHTVNVRSGLDPFSGSRKWPNFYIILLLLLVNAFVGFWEEHQPGAAPKARLVVNARVRRDGKWVLPEARDFIISMHLSGIVPSGVGLLEGVPVEVDQSVLTGESLPATRKPGEAMFSGSIIHQGEIDAMQYATGANTNFGKTTQLVQEADAVSRFQRAVLKIGNQLINFAVAMATEIIAVELFSGDPMFTTLQFALVLPTQPPIYYQIFSTP